VIQDELSPYSQGQEKRTSIEGPALVMQPDLAQAIAVAIHELTTNAAKYGALSVPEGRVRIEWSRIPGGKVELRWTETNGPPVKPPTRSGFGTRAMTTMIRDHLAGELNFDWRTSGLTCKIKFALAQASP
jgi:two-component sensor histidine kinase